MNIIDFEARFADYMRREVREGRMDPQTLADTIEDIYEVWEETPQAFLDGKTPADYFAAMDVPEAVGQLQGYYAASLSPPQALFSRLHILGHDAATRGALAEALFAKLRQDDAPAPLRAYATDALTHMRYAPAAAYFREQLTAEPEHPQANGWHHALSQIEDGHALAHWALDAYPDVSRAAQRRLLDFFADHGGEQALRHALTFFREEEEDRHLPYAAHILSRAAAIGDPDAIEALYGRLRSGPGYVAYKEICHAIEALGGEIPEVEPDFSEDEDYRQMAQMKDDA